MNYATKITLKDSFSVVFDNQVITSRFSANHLKNLISVIGVIVSVCAAGCPVAVIVVCRVGLFLMFLSAVFFFEAHFLHCLLELIDNSINPRIFPVFYQLFFYVHILSSLEPLTFYKTNDFIH